MRYIKISSALIASFAVAAAHATTVFSDNFSSFQLSSGRVGFSGALHCSQNPNGSDPEDILMNYPATTNKWAMLVSSQYPFTWTGTGPTQSWAYSSSAQAIYYHAEKTDYDDGFGWLSNATFNHGKYLVARETVSLDTCIGSCAVGPSLIASEADYRSIYLQNSGTSSSQGQVTVMRYAPCDSRPLLNFFGQPITVNVSSPVVLQMQYRGAEDGGWSYWVNGMPAFIQVNGVRSLYEPGNYLNSKLAANPRLGTYLTVGGVSGNYVEGRVFSASVDELNLVTGANATASSTYMNFPASNGVDGDSSTRWISGGTAPGWIEIDLGAVKTVKKIRLLTAQTPSGNTTHEIYAGTAPSPTSEIGSISGYTVDGQWLTLDLGNWISARYIRIKTTSSPSWVAWKEIQIYQ